MQFRVPLGPGKFHVVVLVEYTFVKAITNLVVRVFSTFQNGRQEKTLDGLTLLLIGQVSRECRLALLILRNMASTM